MNKIYTIYKVTNTLNGKIYIGFTSNFSSRKRLHKHTALNGKNHIFHNSIRKHGWDNFDWAILYQSKYKEHTLVVMEQYFITEYNSMTPNGYNMKLGGTGGNLSEDAKLKISEKRKGMVFSDNHIENLRKSHLGKSLSQEQKDKIGKSVSDKIKMNGRNYKLVKCIHCGLEGKGSNMTRYHFNNCKLLMM
jgi:group I intron endonuclease